MVSAGVLTDEHQRPRRLRLGPRGERGQPFGGAASLASGPIEQLASSVGVTGVPRGLVDQVQQHPA